MFNWKTARDYEWTQIEAISLVLSKHYKLLEFLFEKESPRLRRSPEALLMQAACFSSGERLLIKVALDIWSGSGEAKIWELLETLFRPSNPTTV